jgi:hypothetical protein
LKFEAVQLVRDRGPTLARTNSRSACEHMVQAIIKRLAPYFRAGCA